MQTHEQQVILIADLGYGDAGKGSIVDFLTRQYGAHTIVRYNGGAQAAHNVVTPDGRHHTFAQFGSGTFVPGVRTHLSRFMILHPLAMLAEERALQRLGVRDAFARLSIETGALVITPYQQAANRLKELARGDARHGSCGMGVGETVSDHLAYGDQVLTAGDLADREAVLKKLAFLREAKLAQLADLLPGLPQMDAVQAELELFHDPEVLSATAEVYQHFAGLVRLVESDYLGQLLDQPGAAIFEGAQGVLLDEWYGFYPYNTWSALTFKNAEELLAENGYAGGRLRLGLTRAYATRHGAGPFVTEDAGLTALLQDTHNRDNPWQHEFRVGYLDFVALRYGLRVLDGVDGLVVSHLDRWQSVEEWRTCSEYALEDAEGAAGFFESQDGRVTEIRIPADPTDLERQAKLTRRLMAARPIYTNLEHDADAYLEHIEAKLGAPVVLTSWGMSAGDKRPGLHGAWTAARSRGWVGTRIYQPLG